MRCFGRCQTYVTLAFAAAPFSDIRVSRVRYSFIFSFPTDNTNNLIIPCYYVLFHAPPVASAGVMQLPRAFCVTCRTLMCTLGPCVWRIPIEVVATRIQIRHSDRSVDRNIRISRQLYQVFEPHRMKLKGAEGNKAAASITVFMQRKGIR
jgi:hypothetical protein